MQILFSVSKFSLFSMQALPQMFTYLVTIIIVLIALRVGYQLAIVLKRKKNIIDDGPAGTLVASVMGLLAFILAFAFSSTTDRFNTRKQLLLEEVNAIETAYMRADLIPEPYQAEAKDAIRTYVDLRVELVDAPDSLIYYVDQSIQVQNKMWDIVQAISKEELQNADIVSLFVEAVTNVIEMQNNRFTVGVIYKIPQEVWFLLYTLILFSMVSMGYLFGLKQELNWSMFLILSIAFSAVIILIADLDKSGAATNSIIQINQQPLIDLQKRIQFR